MRALATVLVTLSLSVTARAEVGSGVDHRSCGAPIYATAHIGEVQGEGPLDPPEVRRYLRRILSQVQYCYEKELLAKPGLEGAMTLQLRIAADGKVTEARATGVDDVVAKCVRDRAARMQLPPKDGESVATIPLTFEQGATSGFDTTGCELPKAAIKAAKKLVAAIDAGKTKAFLALVSTRTKFHDRTLTRAKMKKAIASAGSLAAWVSLPEGPWHLSEHDDGYVLYRELAEGVSLGFRFKKKGGWKVVEIRSACELGIGACPQVHPTDATTQIETPE